jgi:hypothetical protein
MPIRNVPFSIRYQYIGIITHGGAFGGARAANILETRVSKKHEGSKHDRFGGTLIGLGRFLIKFTNDDEGRNLTFVPMQGKWERPTYFSRT